MIDIHAHILPSVDDGSPSLEDSLEMARLAVESGVEAIVVTPHCNLPDEPCIAAQQLRPRLDALTAALEAEAIPLRLYPGMEIFGTEHTAARLRSGELCPLAASRYPLIEFPFTGFAGEATDILRSVLRIGLRPIIAHPERYRYTQSDPQLLNRWAEMGCLMQVNRGSLLGRFGSHAEALAHSLVGRRFASFVASDAHSPSVRTPWMCDVQTLLREEYSRNTAWLLLEQNPRCVLCDMELETDEPIWFD